MTTTKTICLYDIIYKDNIKYLSVSSPLQLDNFARTGAFSCYDSKSAPTQYSFILTAEFNSNDIYDQILQRAEEELGLQIESTKIRISD